MNINIIRLLLHIVLVLVIVCAGITLFPFLYMFSSKFLVKEEKSDIYSRMKRTYTYQSLEMNPDTKEYSYGVTTVFDELEQDKFLFSKNEYNGNHRLISHLGSDEYRCTGTCYCETSGKRRNAGILSKSAYYLVAAATTVAAMNHAQNYFEEECERIYNNEDDDVSSCTSVSSEINECSKISEEEQKAFEEKYGITEDDKKIRGGRYWCSGKCKLVDPFMNVLMRDMTKSGGGMLILEKEAGRELTEDEWFQVMVEDRRRFSVTDRMETLNEKRLECNSLEAEGEVMVLEGCYNPDLYEEKKIAEVMFYYHYLDPLCVKNNGVPTQKELDWITSWYDDFLWNPEEDQWCEKDYEVACRRLGDPEQG